MTLTGFERTQFFCGLIFLWRMYSLLLQKEGRGNNSSNVLQNTHMKPLVKEMKNIEEVARIIFFNPEKGEEIITLDRVSEVIKEIGSKIEDYKKELKGQKDPNKLSAILEAVSYLENLRKVLID